VHGGRMPSACEARYCEAKVAPVRKSARTRGEAAAGRRQRETPIPPDVAKCGLVTHARND